MGLRADYQRDVAERLRPAALPPILTVADTAHLPAPVQRYMQVSGAIGQPNVLNFRVHVRGRIRNGPESPWITLEAEQHNFVDPPARLFSITGSMFAIPIQGYHRYVGASATMVIKAAGLIPIVNVSGPEMDQSETVTLFNDMCVMAPATLVSRAIAWELADARTVHATFTNAGHMIHADLSFNDAGELMNFRSDDRYQADGRRIRKVPWSTPLWGYRQFGAMRLASRGEGRWHESDGDYAYIELTIDDVRYNVMPQ
jgi:uncharacterized protein DUF6544